ncbi:MAG: hypothetical protein A2538_02085 [Candidatus Magasanikbacteria bacterium RIFOXYD2_FULL_41_14]|uniref:Sulfatase N-terminal domain-containing protein n=1 Tax=Candidatus Magasanikbacteria bacterium RIFOXYD2_FULL_41_14 TaxID=1798709 RepID=A0A1F6PD75_9BACT|nr:MAG: hypothetical protein A2538_02085 [Candidatus Magasanikbacteria bacterium RIFOXYD2_FULL_41_14]
MSVKNLLHKFKTVTQPILPIIASLFVAGGWSWYHSPHHIILTVFSVSIVVASILAVFFYLFKFFFTRYATNSYRHPFWSNNFPDYLNNIYFSLSLLFLVFFLQNEIISVVYFIAVIAIIFATIQSALNHHPAGERWRTINKLAFTLAIFLFIINGTCQYLASRYYILDPSAKFYNINIFRAWAMTMFWMAGFSAAYLLLIKIKGRAKWLALIGWITIFVVVLVLWLLNIGVLYFSGLYLNPTAALHAEGGEGTLFLNWLTLVLALSGIVALTIFILITKKLIRSHLSTPGQYWPFYHWTIIIIAIFSLVGISSFRTTPEFIVVRSFYKFFTGIQNQVELKPVVKEKLKRFGINYNYDEFYLAHRPNTYPPTSTPLLSVNQTDAKPNIIAIFFESFSARLTEMESPQFKGLTPGLKEMADNQNTTVFTNYYNGSTPTITGLIAQLCSFLPPTGHDEIEKENHLNTLHLSCLPKILKQNGYNYVNYVTAISKTFAHKDTLFPSMGVDEIFGTAELKKLTNEKPLSWGFSDHQLYPLMEKILKDKAREPYLTILSTVDNHPPYTLAQDMVKYGDGKDNMLNSVHTSDDAFKIFWDSFITSPAANDTILIVAADHAIFPTAYNKKSFPDFAGKATFYDKIMYMIYIPDNPLPKSVDTYASSIDYTPTLLQILGINSSNSFDGHSIFSDRSKYPNLIGMHELGLYINEETPDGKRQLSYSVPTEITCGASDYSVDPASPLTLCELLEFYQWKRQRLEKGQFWDK